MGEEGILIKREGEEGRESVRERRESLKKKGMLENSERKRERERRES